LRLSRAKNSIASRIDFPAPRLLPSRKSLYSFHALSAIYATFAYHYATVAYLGSIFENGIRHANTCGCWPECALRAIAAAAFLKTAPCRIQKHTPKIFIGDG
jgi:hypothetical protein